MARVSGATSSTMSTVKAYTLPLILFSLAMFYQLVMLPRSFPPSHYDVLGLKNRSIEAVKEAYENLSYKWDSGENILTTADFIKIRYAYELLINPIWKRDYDLFGIDEQADVIDKLLVQHARDSYSNIELPILRPDTTDPGYDASNAMNSTNFSSLFEKPMPQLLKIYSSGSYRCSQFLNSWKRIVALLDGLANIGTVEVGDLHLTAYLAETKPTGQPFFRNGLPSFIAFPLGCKSLDCLARFEGELSVDAVVDWFATHILNLPRIFYYSKESLVPNFLAKSGPHKVKVIFFSKTGERGTPIMRQAAKDYSNHITFACVLWREEEYAIWLNMLGVESAPAIVFLKDPGVKPLVYHGSANSSWFLDLLEQNKQQELPQLRSLTSMELGCDARGYSRAGPVSTVWYCAMVAGRPSLDLDKMRETMRRVQGILSSDSTVTNEDQSSSAAALAFQNKRLTLAWLDGEIQHKYCFFYLNTETAYEACGPRRAPTDVPHLFIVRYEKNVSRDDINKEKNKRKTIWEFHQDDFDSAAQLSVTYNGSMEVSMIIKWLSSIIMDGDSRNLPYYRVKTPELVSEGVEPLWSRGQKGMLSRSIGLKQKINGFMIRVDDYLRDPRLGPVLLLGALMSFGGIWLIRSEKKQQEASQSSDSTNKDGEGTRERSRRNPSRKYQAASMTDAAPRDAYQVPLSGSDSE